MNTFLCEAVPLTLWTSSKFESLNLGKLPGNMDSVPRQSMCKALVELSSYILESYWPTDRIRLTISHLEVTHVFVERLLRESHTSLSTLLTALIYLCRLRFAQHRIIESGHSIPLITTCGRRMFLCALVSAHKFLQDKSYSSIAWSRLQTCNHLTPTDISLMEIDFLTLLNHQLFVHPKLFAFWNYSAFKLVSINEQKQKAQQHQAQFIHPSLLPQHHQQQHQLVHHHQRSHHLDPNKTINIETHLENAVYHQQHQHTMHVQVSNGQSSQKSLPTPPETHYPIYTTSSLKTIDSSSLNEKSITNHHVQKKANTTQHLSHHLSASPASYASHPQLMPIQTTSSTILCSLEEHQYPSPVSEPSTSYKPKQQPHLPQPSTTSNLPVHSSEPSIPTIFKINPMSIDNHSISPPQMSRRITVNRFHQE